MSVNPHAFIHSVWKDSYIYGGAVRDKILGRRPRDFDYLCIGDFDEIYDAFKEVYTVLPIGIQHNTFVVINPDGDRVEVSTARNLEEKLNSLDFTFNAIAQCLPDLEMVHFSGGWQDIKDKVLNLVTPHALHDDPIRAIRGVRQAREFGFTIDAVTLAKMKVVLSAITLAVPKPENPFEITPYRSWNEMKKVMHSDWWATDNMKQLEQLGLDSPFKLNGMAWRTDNGAPRPSQWQIIRKSLSHLDEAARIKVYQRFRIPTSEREEIEQARL